MKTLDILATAQFNASDNLGGGRRVVNREELERQIAKHRRLRLIWVIIILLSIVAVIGGSLALALARPEQVTQGLLPYMGGSTFIALLELGRRQAKEYFEGDLPLLVLRHGSNRQVAEFIDATLSSLREKGTAAPPSTPTQ